ncbi:MAG: hypothetical protein JWM11_761 [Planctomycetaceae bacterium]|nr:hypothetical protein [Planctomycetaceae bacterium]
MEHAACWRLWSTRNQSDQFDQSARSDRSGCHFDQQDQGKRAGITAMFHRSIQARNASFEVAVFFILPRTGLYNKAQGRHVPVAHPGSSGEMEDVP